MKILSLTLPLIFIAGCSTTAKIIMPPGTSLILNDHPVKTEADGTLNSRQFSWGTAGGIKYKLVRGGNVLDEGKLKSHFRVVSIFWPPVAIAYWPMGFEYEQYDLTHPDPSKGVKSEMNGGAVKAEETPKASKDSKPKKHH